MPKFLVVFEEAAGPETFLCSTREAAIKQVQTIRDEYVLTDEDMQECTLIYTVTEQFSYQPPVGSAGLKSEMRFEK